MISRNTVPKYQTLWESFLDNRQQKVEIGNELIISDNIYNVLINSTIENQTQQTKVNNLHKMSVSAENFTYWRGEGISFTNMRSFIRKRTPRRETKNHA